MAEISIIVPVYGVELYLRECLESIRTQSFGDIEVIVVDDGSPDKCPNIIDEYVKRDRRFIAIHKDNAGVSAARNDGLALATGKYVFLCDSDDWLPTNALELLFETAEANDADVSIGDYIEHSEMGERRLSMFSNPFSTTQRRSIELIQKAVFNKGRTNYSCDDFDFTYGLGAPWHHLIRRNLIAHNGLEFDLGVKSLFDDGLFMLEVFEHTNTVVYVQEPTYYYRVVNTSITHGYKADLLERYQKVYSALEDFINRYDKDYDFNRSYYIRVYAYLNKAMTSYFQNPANAATLRQRYAEYIRTLNSNPYAIAIREMDESVLGYGKSRMLARLLKMRANMLYWIAKQLFSK